MNYSLIPREARANSSLENYNGYINKILGDKEEINWLNFLTFIKDEVERWEQKVSTINIKLIEVIKGQNNIYKNIKNLNLKKKCYFK